MNNYPWRSIIKIGSDIAITARYYNTVHIFSSDNKLKHIINDRGANASASANDTDIISKSSCLCYDEKRNILFVSDVGKNQVHMFNNKFTHIRSIGSGGDIKFNEPYHMTVTDDELVVCDYGGHCLQFFDIADSKFKRSITELSGINFCNPTGICFDEKKELLYVADAGNRRICVLDKIGNFIRSFKTNKNSYYYDICLSNDKQFIFAVDCSNHCVTVIDLNDETNIISHGSFGKGKKEFSDPRGLCLNGNELLVCDYGSCRIVRVNIEK